MSKNSFEEKIAILKKVNIFSDSGEDILRELASDLEEVKALKGKNIIRKGESGDAMFILVEGTVRIHDGDHVLAKLDSGEVFGEYSLIDQENRSASVTAETDCTLYRLRQDDFLRLAGKNKDIIRNVLKVLIQRIRGMNELEEKLSRSYIKIQKQKAQIESMSQSIHEQKLQLEQQNYDLSKLNEEKNSLIGILVHQIKNPLTSSLCLTEMLAGSSLSMDKHHKESLEIIHNSLQRINSLVDENLNVNVIDSKVFQLKYEKVRLKKIIRELIESYRYLYEQKQVSVIADLDDIEASVNRVYFTQIIDNILSNAVKFTRINSTIQVILKRSANNLRIEIADEGAGIDENLVKKLFHLYKRQTDMHSQAEYPRGLGLAIAYRYTSEMGGTIHCESLKDKGSRFIVELPLQKTQ